MWQTVWQEVQRIWGMPLIQVDQAWITPGKIFVALVIFIIGLSTARLLSRWLVRRLLDRLHVPGAAATAIQIMARYCLVMVAVLVSLQIAGVPLATFTFFGGAVALAVGFGSQNILNNFLSSLILLIERPIKPGDLVQIGDLLGRVDRIGARATVLTGYQGNTHLIPNSHFLEKAVTNWHFDDNVVVATVAVGVAYGADVDVVRRLLLDIARQQPGIAATPEPLVLFHDLAESSLNFELLVWAPCPSVLARRRIESELRFAIVRDFRAHGVVIAYPQRDLHLDASQPIPVQVVAGAGGAPRPV